MFGHSIFKNYSSFINIFSRISDPLLIILAAYLAYGFRFSFLDLDFPKDYKMLVLFSVFGVMLLFPLFGLYSSWRGQSLTKQAKIIFFAWVSVVLLLIVLLFGLKLSSEYSRIWLVSWGFLGLILTLTMRILIYAVLQYLRTKGRNIRHVVIVGGGDLGKRAITQIYESPWAGYKVSAVFDDDASLKNSHVFGVEVVGDISDVEPLMAKLRR